MSHKVLTDENFQEEIRNNRWIYVVDFRATRCQPCKMLSPIFDNLSKKFPEINFWKCDVDENQTTSLQYQIQWLPTILIFKDGKQITEPLMGVRSEKDYETVFEHILKVTNWENKTPSTPPLNPQTQDIIWEKTLKEAIQSDKIVIVDFRAERCTPCKVIKPVLEKIAADHPDTITLLKIDIDNPLNQSIAFEYKVASIPQLSFFKDWKEVETIIGTRDYEEIVSIAKKRQKT